MRGLRVLLSLSVAISGCSGGPGPSSMDAGPDASVDAGPKDAGPQDAGVDAGPVCGPEVCDGLDNDCNGSIDVAADGGALTQACPLQAGPCAGARVACAFGAFPPCTPTQYGPKYEEFESLCDGVDNDCSGVVDVSQWRPIGAAGEQTSAVSVPGAWYVATGLNAQMFDESLKPLSDVFPVGKPGHVSAGAVWFGDYMQALFAKAPVPGPIYLRRLNLDGTYVVGLGEEHGLLPGHPEPLSPGGLRVSNDRSTLLVAFTQPAQQAVLTLFTDAGVRAGLREVGDAGAWQHASTAVGAQSFVTAVPTAGGLELAALSANLVPLLPRVKVPVPGAAIACAISANTHALDAGPDALVVVCPDAQRTLYGVEDVFAGGLLAPFFTADAGTVTSVVALPSYARATVFWLNGGTVFMGQVNAPPLELATLSPAPAKLEVAESVRGGYLLQAVFDGGQGLRPYGAYACPP